MLRGISNGKTVPIMNIEEQALHPKLVSLIELAPIIKELNSTDVAVTISDQEKVIHQIFSNEFSVDYWTVVPGDSKREYRVVPKAPSGS